MTPVDTLIHARWVVPVRPRATVLEQHALAVHDGRIVAVLPSAQADAEYRPAQRIELPTHVLTPGWVNVHTHAAMSLLRGVGDDLPLMQWLQQRIWPLETALADEQFVHDGSQLAALEMLRAGTTTCSDMYFYPDVAARALRSVGLRAVVGIIAIEMPTAYASDADDYLRKGLAARDSLRNDPLVHFTLAPHAPYTVADATLRHIATLAEELDLPIHIHVHETRHEIDESLAQHGLRPLARLDQLGLVSERLIAVHGVHFTDAEIGLLAARGVTVAHCPASNLKLASGIAPIARLLAAGVRVAIGTDGAASNNRLDLIEETRLAALLAKGAAGDAAALPAWQALECATLCGATALGLEKRIGSLEPGKDADLAAFDLAAAETTPCYDPVSHLIYAASRERVTDVWVAGRQVVHSRQVVSDQPALERDILNRAGAWQSRAQRQLQSAA